MLLDWQNIQDQFASVDDLAAKFFLNIPKLTRTEIVIEHDNSRTQLLDRCVQFLNLAFAEACSSIHSVAILDQLPDRLHTPQSRQVREVRSADRDC